MNIRPGIMSGLRKAPFIPSKKVSLSNYFPAGTFYFYGYPYGEDFLLKVPPEMEELVAGRVAACAGDKVSGIMYTGTQAPAIDKELISKLELPKLPESQSLTLPPSIDFSLTGKKRDQAIIDFLLDKVPAGKLVMAQPYTDAKAASLYQIEPKITTWMNDKKHMGDYINEQFISKRFAIYKNGSEFKANHEKHYLPYAVKVSSSSSGDGVYLCLTEDNLKTALKELENIRSTILIEQYIEARKNYGVHFGIPADPKKPIDIIGVNEQLTSDDGVFIGSIINSKNIPEELYGVRDYLLQDALPKIRDMGWYGIGCFDVLADDDGGYHFIDANFRMTGVSAYHFMLANGKLKEPLMSFAGEFDGNQAEFETQIVPFASPKDKQSFVRLITLSHHAPKWRFNGTISYENKSELKEKAARLLDSGVKSEALSQIISS
jgi:hypothetical protein